MLAHSLHHLPPARDHLERFGDVPALLGEPGDAARLLRTEPGVAYQLVKEEELAAQHREAFCRNQVAAAKASTCWGVPEITRRSPASSVVSGVAWMNSCPARFTPTTVMP